MNKFEIKFNKKGCLKKDEICNFLAGIMYILPLTAIALCA